MIADVRGSLGAQVVSLMAQAAAARELGRAIERVRLNVGGRIQPESAVDYMTQIFRRLPPIERTDSCRKVDLTDPAVYRILLRHRDAVLSDLDPVPAAARNGTDYLHVRTGDRQPTSAETFEAWARSNPVTIIGSNPSVVRELARVTGRKHRVGRDAVDDWLALRSARSVTGSLSWFVLSLLFLEPGARVTILPQDGPIPVRNEGVRAFRAVSGAFPNLGWVDAG